MQCNSKKKICDQIFPDFILIFNHIYSHELNYIGATTCFMSLGQSSGNWFLISIIRQASRMSEGMHNYSYHSAQNMNREKMPVTHVVPFDAIKGIHYTYMGPKALWIWILLLNVSRSGNKIVELKLLPKNKRNALRILTNKTHSG